MICRLCLHDSYNFLTIFDEDKTGGTCAGTDVVKIILRYINMELNATDMVSNKLCSNCWQQLYDFDQFCQMVEDKQRMLQEQLKSTWVTLKQLPEFTTNKDLADGKSTQATIESVALLEDVKNITLCEPEIDAFINNDDDEEPTICCKLEHEFGAADDNVTLKDVDNLPAVMELVEKVKRKYTRRQKNVLSKDVPKRVLRSTSQSTNCTVRSITKKSKTIAKIKTKMKKAMNKRNVKDLMKERKPKSLIESEADAYIAEHTTLNCCLCSQPLANFIDLKRHFRKEHNCIGYVPCCNNRYKKRAIYADHLRLHKDPEYFKCLTCNKNLASRNCYNTHMLQFHTNPDELNYQCEYCQRKFAKHYILQMHLRQNHKTNERTYKCGQCDKTFRTSIELNAHVKRIHLKDYPLIICDICGENFKTKQTFLSHKLNVHKIGQQEPEMQCHICNRWLKNARGLKKHIDAHADKQLGKSYVCNHCGVVKSTRISLNSHVRYQHTGKKFRCTLCDKVFKRPIALDEHMATHTGQDLYTCWFCPQTFKSHANMYNHKKKMHPFDVIPKAVQSVRKVNIFISAEKNKNTNSTQSADDAAQSM